MHHMEIEGWNFNYNGDFSGDVVISTPEGDARLGVPFSALKGFMAEYFRERIVTALEGMDGNELLDRLTNPPSEGSRHSQEEK